jgi:hypothetical protein
MEYGLNSDVDNTRAISLKTYYVAVLSKEYSIWNANLSCVCRAFYFQLSGNHGMESGEVIISLPAVTKFIDDYIGDSTPALAYLLDQCAHDLERIGGPIANRNTASLRRHHD